MMNNNNSVMMIPYARQADRIIHTARIVFCVAKQLISVNLLHVVIITLRVAAYLL